MEDMAREPAEWRSHMRDDEREELARAERMRDVAAENLRVTVKRFKDRVIKRMRRADGAPQPQASANRSETNGRCGVEHEVFQGRR